MDDRQSARFALPSDRVPEPSGRRRFARCAAMVALVFAVVGVLATPAFAGPVTIVGVDDSYFATIDEGSFFELPLMAIDDTGDPNLRFTMRCATTAWR